MFVLFGNYKSNFDVAIEIKYEVNMKYGKYETF